MNSTMQRRGGLALAAFLIVLGAAGSAFAEGTAAGQAVSNTATVDFSVGGVSQTTIPSTPVVFTVDRKIDVLVTEVGGSFTTSRPGSTDQVLTFTVENEGNEVQDFVLTAVDGDGNTVTLGGVTETDDFNATAPTPPGIWLDDGDGSFSAATDTELAYLDNFAVDTPRTVFVVRNIASTESDGAASFITLNAAAVENSGTPAAPGAALTEDTGPNVLVDTTPQIVFADGDGSTAGGNDADRDGAHSAVDGYIIRSAQLTISKTAEVVSDPFGNTAPDAKAIPGSIVEYTIRIENGAAATETATGISISDDLTSEMSGAVGGPRLALVLAAYGSNASGEDIQLETDASGSTVTSELSAAADADDGEFVSDALSVDNLVLDPGEFAEVKFQVEIL